jgi:regulator of nucleoside diphosphate kinase
MRVRKVLITRGDLFRLEELIECALRFQPLSHEHLIEVQEELERATILEAEKIPEDTVTMNSEVFLKDLSDGTDLRYKVVYPRDAHLDKNRISVLAPLGAALLGRRKGEVFECNAPGGVRQFKVEEVTCQRGIASKAD